MVFYHYQRTIAHPVSCTGIGLHTGKMTNMSIKPGEADTGIVFVRTDINDKNPEIRANYRNVSNTMLGTSVTNASGTTVATIEHLMAALWGCGIDNAIVEIDNEEIPIMDGSSKDFVFLLECAGVRQLEKTRLIIEVRKRVEVRGEDAFVSINPSDQFSVSLEIDFDNPVISKQHFIFDSRDLSFKNDLCRARTFGLADEVEQLRSMGLAQGGSLHNAIVVNNDSILNEGGLRFNDEFVRHKILDCIGDTYLAGGYLQGHIHGYRSGHDLNNQLLREFFADEDAYRVIRLPENNRPNIPV